MENMDNFSLIKNILFIALAISVTVFILCKIDEITAPKLLTLCVFSLFLFLISGIADKITEISGLGINAKLERKIEEADEILNQLREFAIENAKQLIMLKLDSDNITVGDSDPRAKDDAFKAQVIQSLRKMGIPENRIKEVEHVDRDLVLDFYSHAVFRYGRDLLPNTDWEKYDADYYKLKKDNPPSPSPDQMQAFLGSYKINISDFSSHMEDFIYYFKNTEQRRPDVWAKRGDWGYGKRD